MHRYGGFERVPNDPSLLCYTQRNFDHHCRSRSVGQESADDYGRYEITSIVRVCVFICRCWPRSRHDARSGDGGCPTHAKKMGLNHEALPTTGLWPVWAECTAKFSMGGWNRLPLKPAPPTHNCNRASCPPPPSTPQWVEPHSEAPSLPKDIWAAKLLLIPTKETPSYIKIF